TVDRYRKRFGLDFLPVVLEQTSDSGDGLVRDWPRPASGSAKHYGYAFQWGGMATLIVILYVYFTFRKSSAARAS
ncbi:MAG: SURF1 family cytochrome oxidase biogenesis protein, partial [Alphaproteobacteria bacterium]